MGLARALVLAAVLALPGAAAAHDGVVHATPAEAAAHRDRSPADTPPPPFPVEIRADFDLVDHHGNRVTQRDFAGRPMIVFFGYVSCEGICSVAIPRIVRGLERAGPAAADVVPVIITVDPAHDTPEAMRRGLAVHGGSLVGLTGSEAALAAARAAFQVEVEQVGTMPNGRPLYMHGSFIYLIGGDGAVRAMVPPILGEQRLAELIARHL